MGIFFGTDFYGKRTIVSHYDHCGSCHKLVSLSSYTTMKFINLRQLPLVPVGKVIRVTDECPHCGHRTISSNRKYRKKRKEDLAGMMDGFSSEGDNPYAALNGLQTLQVYNEESWFMDVMQSYGRRFDTHMVVQLLIAQGLCRFGHYSKAEVYARKAIVLGAGPHAEELLTLCQAQFEKMEAGHVDTSVVQAESIVRPYAFVALVGISLVAGIAIYGVSATRYHTAWLVNGSNQPYSVEVDGTLYRLNSYGLKRIKLRLGKHEMQTHDLPGRTLPVSFNYKISLLKQKVGDHTLVLNPDAFALLVKETRLGGEITNQYLFGDVINELEGVGYPFSSFPAWADAKHSAQTRLFNHVPSNHLEMVELLHAHSDRSDATGYARRVLVAEPAGEEVEALLQIATSDLTLKQTLAFLQRGKAVLPPVLLWHHFYQNLMETQQPEYDLQTEYGLLCKAHPDTPEYYYLLARVARKRVTAKLFFVKSEEGSGSHGLGFYAVAYDLLCSGEFIEAQTYSKKALKQSPNHEQFKALDQHIQLALQEYEGPLRNLEAGSNDIDTVANKVKYLTLLGEHKAAEATIESFSDAGEGRGSYLKAARFYAVGNVSDYLENLVRSGRGNALLQKHLHAGKVKAAHQYLSLNETHEYTAHLILYCAAHYHGYPELAEIELAKARAELGALTPAQRVAIGFLSSDTPPSIQAILELRMMPMEKSILCASLGFKFPAQKPAFFKLSRKLNYTPQYPHLLLKKWMRNAVQRQPAPSS